MRLLTIATAFAFSALNASQFILKADLEASLSIDSGLASSVGTVFTTNIDYKSVKDGDKVLFGSGTCFAIGPKHLLAGAHTFAMIPDLKDCFVTMLPIMMYNQSGLPACLETELFQKVKSIKVEPTGANLAILELEEALDEVTALSFGKFSDGPVMGISTAKPSLLGEPRNIGKSCHTFSCGSVQQREDILESCLLVSTDVTPKDVQKGAIRKDQVIGYCGSSCTSLLSDGDDGAPVFQNGKVVAVSGGWSLHAAHWGAQPVHLVINNFTLVDPYMEWIQSIIEPDKKITKEAEAIDDAEKKADATG